MRRHGQWLREQTFILTVLMHRRNPRRLAVSISTYGYGDVIHTYICPSTRAFLVPHPGRTSDHVAVGARVAELCLAASGTEPSSDSKLKDRPGFSCFSAFLLFGDGPGRVRLARCVFGTMKAVVTISASTVHLVCKNASQVSNGSLTNNRARHI
jgi:hypothetical protein